jgi:hypothetical protein
MSSEHQPQNRTKSEQNSEWEAKFEDHQKELLEMHLDEITTAVEAAVGTGKHWVDLWTVHRDFAALYASANMLSPSYSFSAAMDGLFHLSTGLERKGIKLEDMTFNNGLLQWNRRG